LKEKIYSCVSSDNLFLFPLQQLIKNIQL